MTGFDQKPQQLIAEIGEGRKVLVNGQEVEAINPLPMWPIAGTNVLLVWMEADERYPAGYRIAMGW